MKKKVLAFLKNRSPKLCTLATIGPVDNPQNTLVGYGVLDDLTIIINTNFHTRKWKNITEKSHVALVFGFGFDELNIQYEGSAELLDLAHPNFQELQNFFFTQNPDARKFKSPETRLIHITPLWIRMMDPSTNPPAVEEKTFSA